MKWGTGGVKAGDNLYICGLHIYGHTPQGSSETLCEITASGNDENSRIIIRGDYSGDPGTIWGNYVTGGSQTTWNYEGDNTYSCASSNTYGYFYFENISGTWDLMTRVDSVAECKSTPGSYYSENFDYPDPIYFHCSDNGEPNLRVSTPTVGYNIDLNGNSYVTFLNIDFYQPYFHGLTGQYLKWEGCKLWYMPAGFRLWDNTQYCEIINCDRAYGMGGFGFNDDDPYGIDGPHHMTIRGCTIHDIGVYMQNEDAEGIGSNGVDYLTVEYNEFYNCGTAYQSYPHTNSSQINTIIRWNYVHDSHKLNGARGMGIAIGKHPPNAMDCSGNQVYGNIVANCPSHAYSSTYDLDEVVFYNNIAYNCDTSFYFNATYREDNGPKIVFKNNISINPTGQHLYFGSVTSEGNYTLNSDYNLFYPDKQNGFGFKGSDYSVYPDLSGWQVLSRSGCTFDPHSIVADPMFVDPDNGNFNLLPGSLAIDAGIDVGLTRDSGGNPIPLGSAPDIGAYESIIDPDNPPPVLQAIGNKSVGENVTLTFVVSATDPDSEPITYLAQDLPSGATLDSQTGDFTWTPSYNQAGTYHVRFIASDGNSHDSETITITVNNVNRPPVLGFIADPSVDENSLLSFSVDATDPDGQTLTYSVSGLPSGAVFASQTFTWTPTYDQAGTFAVTFAADDGQDQDSQVVTITVVNVNRAPVFSAIGNKSVWSDDPLTFTVDATDPDGDAVTFSTNTVPSGATFVTETFDWTPTAAQIGAHNVTFYASDGQLQDSEAISITVNVDSVAPTITNLSPTAGAIQVPLNNLITLNVIDAEKGIDPTSVKIKVRINDNPSNDTIYFGDIDHDNTLLGDCRRIGNNANYKYVFQPTQDLFYNDQTITITVNVADLAGNVMDEYSYSFETEMHLFGQNKLINTNSDNNDRPVTVCDSNGNIWAAWHTGSAGSRDIFVSKQAVGGDNFGSAIQLTNDINDQCNPV
ncbi:MAG: putative Ig domain-containing protein, partial [Thermoplasmata archaeon]